MLRFWSMRRLGGLGLGSLVRIQGPGEAAHPSEAAGEGAR